jgi:hypothetical protein
MSTLRVGEREAREQAACFAWIVVRDRGLEMLA